MTSRAALSGPRARRLAAGLLLVSLLGLAACHRRVAATDQAPEIRVTVETNPATPRVGDGKLRLSFLKQDGSPQLVTHLSLRGDMTHPGMAPWLAEVDLAGDAEIDLPVSWSMAGDWILRLEADLDDGRRLIRDLPIAVLPATES